MDELVITNGRQMDRELESRQPTQKHQGNNNNGLSFVSKVFFGFDIFQVIIVVVFQSLMIALGNFNAYNSPESPGFGPGRRIYMGLYMGAVMYTCILCLFAVKQQNFMEILAFLLQNFGFVTYGLIQVYHVGYKNYDKFTGSNATIQHSNVLRNIAISNSLVLSLLNAVFMFLSWKLYIEFGWKIYKRVRFNLRLRSIYHWYQLLSCLLKMEILYWWMYAICNSFVLLEESGSNAYYVNLALVPFSLIYAGIGNIATKREIKVLMIIFLALTFSGAVFFIYKLYGFITDTCLGCLEFHQTGQDIHDEAILHFVYLGTLNLCLLLAILGVAYKVYSNFGRGLGEHFYPKFTGRNRAPTDLNLRRLSHYIEESVISVTSFDSENDELGESTRFNRGDVMLSSAGSAVPLLQDNLSVSSPERTSRSSSLPNIKEAASRKSESCPSFNETELKALDDLLARQTSDSTERVRGKLDSIAEDGNRSRIICGHKRNGVKEDGMDGMKTNGADSRVGGNGIKDSQTRGKNNHGKSTNSNSPKGSPFGFRGKPCLYMRNGSNGSGGNTADCLDDIAGRTCEATDEVEDDVFRNSVTSRETAERDSGCLDCQMPNEHHSDKPGLLAKKGKYVVQEHSSPKSSRPKSEEDSGKARRKSGKSSLSFDNEKRTDDSRLSDCTEVGSSVEQRVKRYLKVCQ